MCADSQCVLSRQLDIDYIFHGNFCVKSITTLKDAAFFLFFSTVIHSLAVFSAVVAVLYVDLTFGRIELIANITSVYN